MKSNLQKEVILITETNFVLDIVFEQSKECERLLAVIHKQNIKLIIPEYSFAEAEGTIVNIIQNRIISIDSALDALRQASRSAYHALDDFITQLQQHRNNIEQVEIEQLRSRMKILEESAIIIAFTPESMAKAEIRRLKKIAPFKSTDGMIYESILEFARINQNPNMEMLFLTRDRNDFDFPYIREELSSINAEIFFSAGDCIKRIRELI